MCRFGASPPDAEEHALPVDQLPEPPADGPRNAYLPLLSSEQAAALHQLAEQAFQTYGVPAQADGYGSVIAGDWVYGLSNLSRLVAAAPWAEWPSIVDAHVAVVAAANDTDSDDEDVRPDQWLLKLRPVADLPMELDFDAPSGLPGIAAVPAIDFPTYVRELLGIDQVRRFADLDDFQRQALANLRALPAPEVTPVTPDESDPGNVVFAMTSDDYYGAARFLVLDHLIRAQLKAELPEHGCVIAIPNRHMLLVHPVTGAGVFTAIPAMVNIAQSAYAESPGPVSEHLYFVSAEGHAQQLTHRQAEQVAIVVDGAFELALSDLELVGGS
jgi:hypothetical protein